MSTFDNASRLAELAEDWKYTIQTNGLCQGSLMLLKEFLRLPFQHIDYVLFSRSLLDPLPDFQPKISMHIRDFKCSDVESVRLMDRPSEAKLCAKRLSFNHLGLLALHDDRPIGHIWGSTEVEPSIERVKLELKLGDFLYADAFTDPDFRGMGVQTALSLALYRKFRALGYLNSIAYVSEKNHPSLTVFHKLGSKKIGYLKYYRLGLWRWMRLKLLK